MTVHFPGSTYTVPNHEIELSRFLWKTTSEIGPGGSTSSFEIRPKLTESRRGVNQFRGGSNAVRLNRLGRAEPEHFNS